MAFPLQSLELADVLSRVRGVSLLASEPPDEFVRAALNRRTCTDGLDGDWHSPPDVRWDRAPQV